MPMREIRLTVRSLARTPLYTLTAILSLALGIGATTAIFSMMRPGAAAHAAGEGSRPAGVPLSPRAGAGQLVDERAGRARPSATRCSARCRRSRRRSPASPARTTVAASVAYNNNAVERVARCWSPATTSRCSASAPAMGRVFDENDDRETGGHPLVVLSHAYWTSRFGADPGMLNRTMVVNGRGMTIVGVAQKGFSSENAGQRAGALRADHA